MFGWFKNRNRDAIVSRIYAEIVAQSRLPVFYQDFAVPDTLEGRYELAVLHMVLVVHRFRNEDEAARDAAQEVCDRFFLEMDRALREMGVGDISIPKRMKKIAGLYALRARIYGEALDQNDDVALSRALGHALLNDDAPPREPAIALAAYVRHVVAGLAAIPPMVLIESGVTFPEPTLNAIPLP